MCFIKAKSPKIPKNVEEDIVQRKQADSTLTKTSQNQSSQQINPNIKTTALGLEGSASVQKKTLLGE